MSAISLPANVANLYVPHGHPFGRVARIQGSATGNTVDCHASATR